MMQSNNLHLVQVDGAALTEQMIRSFQVEVEEEEIVELSGEDELRNLMREKTST